MLFYSHRQSRMWGARCARSGSGGVGAIVTMRSVSRALLIIPVAGGGHDAACFQRDSQASPHFLALPRGIREPSRRLLLP